LELIAVPTQVGTDTDWKSVQTGGGKTFALKQDGSLWAWGSNYNGTLGVGSNADYVTVPTRVGTNTDWKSVQTRGVTFALKQDGSLWAWGYNWGGWLGVGSDADYVTIPTQLGADTDWKSVQMGGIQMGGSMYIATFAIKQDGSLWAWGYNWGGWLGVGSDADYVTVLTQVGTDTDWNSVQPGGYSTFAIKKDGSLWAWGGNRSGGLGVGSTADDVTVPTQVGTDRDWKSVQTGAGTTFALKREGSLWAWGENTSRNLGVGSTAETVTVPTRVETDTSWAR
jgi:alpha-tubulin suppressor-like RCC1 family protein